MNTFCQHADSYWNVLKGKLSQPFSSGHKSLPLFGPAACNSLVPLCKQHTQPRVATDRKQHNSKHSLHCGTVIWNTAQWALGRPRQSPQHNCTRIACYSGMAAFGFWLVQCATYKNERQNQVPWRWAYSTVLSTPISKAFSTVWLLGRARRLMVHPFKLSRPLHRQGLWAMLRQAGGRTDWAEARAGLVGTQHVPTEQGKKKGGNCQKYLQSALCSIRVGLHLCRRSSLHSTKNRMAQRRVAKHCQKSSMAQIETDQSEPGN